MILIKETDDKKGTVVAIEDSTPEEFFNEIIALLRAVNKDSFHRNLWGMANDAYKLSTNSDADEEVDASDMN